MEPREEHKPHCVTKERRPTNNLRPKVLQPGPGGAIVLSEMPESSARCSSGAALGQAGLARGKAEPAAASVRGAAGLLTRGEYFRKEVAGSLQMSFIAVAVLQKACFSEYTDTLINLMIALCM